MKKLIAFVIVLFAMLFDLRAVMALEFPSSGLFGSFPSTRPFTFPSKTPKPTSSANPTSTPIASATPAPTSAPTLLEIEDIEPNSANFMDEFVIYGANFGTGTGSVSLRVSNQNYSSGGAPIVSWTDNEIKARVPAVRKGAYRVQVITSDGKKSNEIRFSVKNGQPIINSSSISLVNGEYEMTFQGTELGSRRGSVDIYNGDSLAGNGIIKSWSSSKVRFDLPALPNHEYGFQITTSDGRKSSLKFFTVGN